MKNKIRSVIKYFIFLGTGVFLTWWQISQMTSLQKIQFKESLLHAHYIYLVPAIIITLISHISRAARWKILIEPMGYHTKVSSAFYATMCGYLANTFLPRVGEILRCTLLSRNEKIPVSKLLGTILVERIFDLCCYFLLLVITFLIQVGRVTDFLKTGADRLGNFEQPVSVWLIFFIVLVVGGIFLLIGKWIFKKYKSHHYIIRLKGMHIGLKEGFSTILHLKKRKKFIAHSLLIWACYLSQIYIGFSALTATSSLGVSAAFSVLSLVTLAMIISPGGLGAFPVAVQQVLLIYNVHNISFGWLMWGVTTGIVLVLGSISFGLLIYQNKHSNEKEQQSATKNIFS